MIHNMSTSCTAATYVSSSGIWCGNRLPYRNSLGCLYMRLREHLGRNFHSAHAYTISILLSKWQTNWIKCVKSLKYGGNPIRYLKEYCFMTQSGHCPRVGTVYYFLSFRIWRKIYWLGRFHGSLFKLSSKQTTIHYGNNSVKSAQTQYKVNTWYCLTRVYPYTILS